MARQLAEEKGLQKEFAFMELIEERAINAFMNFKGSSINKQVCTNVDYYSGFVYNAIGLPREVYTPLFAMSRIVGWSAHRIEELNFTSKRIIRPAYKNVGEKKPFIPLEER
jgi:citrate synthase